MVLSEMSISAAKANIKTLATAAQTKANCRASLLLPNLEPNRGMIDAIRKTAKLKENKISSMKGAS